MLLVKCDFSYSCAAADKISTDLRACVVSLQQLSYLFTVQMLFLKPNQQYQRTEGTTSLVTKCLNHHLHFNGRLPAEPGFAHSHSVVFLQLLWKRISLVIITSTACSTIPTHNRRSTLTSSRCITPLELIAIWYPTILVFTRFPSTSKNIPFSSIFS